MKTPRDALDMARVAKSEPISWTTLLAGLVVVGFVNGISLYADGCSARQCRRRSTPYIRHQRYRLDRADHLLPVFTSADQHPATRWDQAAAILSVAFFLMPAPSLSWIGLSGLGAYLVASQPPGSDRRRGGWILLALTVPLYWSPLVFSLMSGVILQVDAILVSLVLRTARFGNSVAFADGWGYFYIAPPCSSLANVSLAFLCGVLMTQSLGTAARQGFSLLLACRSGGCCD